MAAEAGAAVEEERRCWEKIPHPQKRLSRSGPAARKRICHEEAVRALTVRIQPFCGQVNDMIRVWQSDE